MLLVMEAIDEGVISLSDMVTVSDVAASMGGSQIYLEVGEQTRIRTVNSTDCSSKKGACAVPNFDYNDEDDDENSHASGEENVNDDYDDEF